MGKRPHGSSVMFVVSMEDDFRGRGFLKKIAMLYFLSLVQVHVSSTYKAYKGDIQVLFIINS